MERLVGLCTTGGCPSSFEQIAHQWNEDPKVEKAAAYLLTFQSIREVIAEATTVRHQGSALLLKNKDKNPKTTTTCTQKCCLGKCRVSMYFL